MNIAYLNDLLIYIIFVFCRITLIPLQLILDLGCLIIKYAINMKKIVILFLFITLTSSLNAQLNGLGTSASPYNGTFQGDPQWNSTNFPSHKVYINGDVTIDNELLTIEGGMSIIFVSTGADLIITATGQLNAAGTSGNKITFTADFTPFNGIYGETGERWGHIIFENMTSTNPQNYPSVIDNCIIEYGQKSSSPFGFETCGGGMYIAFTYLTISNSIVRNNYAGWGGGIFVDASFSPSIINSIISNNTAGTTAGGILIYSNNATQLKNCIIEKNTCLGNGGAGGVFLGEYPGAVRFYNCIIASNTSTLNYGHNILFYYDQSPSIRPKFYNTIVWGSNSPSITSWNSTYSSDDFNYSALTSGASNYISCININTSNSASDGPNFIDPNNLNYSIKVISPCRDMGTSSGAPSTDFLGNNRIGNYDIGAYEVQYNGWKTSAPTTDWNTGSNWDQGSVPASSSSNVVIPTGAVRYPMGSSYTIGAGYGMVLDPGAQLTMTSLTNNGDLKLRSDASNISSLISNSSGVTTAIIELYLTGGEAGSKNYKWHYISTPISSLPVSTFTTVTPDIVRYYDSRVSTDLVQGWVAQDGWIYASGSGGGPTFTFLTPGLGYDFYDSNNNTFTFSGQLNTADVPMTLDYNGGANNGFNLLGNPFSSGLDWNYIISHRFPSSTSKSLYFTRDNALCSYIAGVGSPSDVNGYIPPMQGFFTKTYATSKTIYLADSARTHSLHARFKGTEIIPLIRLSLSDDSLSDETVVRFDEKALPVLDNDFDAVKIFYSNDNTAIYSEVSGIKYVINGQPYPETWVEIPLGINVKFPGNHAINTTQLQGIDSYKAELIDNSTGFIANLKTTPVLTFSAPVGSISDRFILKISNISTGTEIPTASKDIFNIFNGFGFINIQTLSDDWDGKQGSVRILDFSGKTIIDLHNIGFSKNSVTRVTAPSATGLYIVELRSGVNRYVGKVVIN
jgi:hypothetical protein